MYVEFLNDLQMNSVDDILFSIHIGTGSIYYGK